MRVRCRNTGYLGLMQTLVDGGKLFTKKNGLSFLFIGFFFFLCSYFTLQFSFINLLYLLLGLSFCSISIFFSSYGNLSSFALISNIRVILMGISFDLVFSFFLILNIFSFCLSYFFLLFLFIAICLMELGRTPFDLVEGESELVSGYNIEYGRFGFTCLFLAEYLRFFWIFILMKILFLYKMFISIFFILFLVLIRSVLP